MAALPVDVNYQLDGLPSTVKAASYVSRSTNGATFTSNNTVQFQLVNNQGLYLEPGSMYISFRIKVTGDAAASNLLLGVPAASCWSRSSLQANSTSIEDINNYGSVVSALLHSKLSTSAKSGLSKPFGLTFAADAANSVDSHTIGTGAVENIIEVCIPLMNALNNAEKMIPLDSAQFQIYMTLDELANFSAETDGTATSLTGFSVDNCEIHYRAVQFPPDMDRAIKSQVDGAGDIYFKTQSYASSVQNIPAATSGNVSLNFAQSLTSIKSVWCQFCKADTFKNFASYNVTNGAGSLGWVIAGTPYNQQRLDLTNHESDAVLEYLQAIHGTAVAPELSSSLSVNNFRTINTADANGKDLSKAYFGVSTERLGAKQYMLTGVSSQGSNTVLELSIDGGATNVSCQVIQVWNYDLLMKYSPAMNTLVVLK